MFSVPHPWNRVSAGYEATTMDFLSQYAHTALSEVSLAPDSWVLDVACGPGTLSRLVASRVARVDALDFSDDMIRLLGAYVRESQLKTVFPCLGDGQHLPYLDNTYDAAFSMFGLMFFPDRVKGFSELYRTLKPGGVAVVSAWAPITQSPAMQLMFGAMREMQPEIPSPSPAAEGLADPVVFQKEMALGGFLKNKIVQVRHVMRAETVNDLWHNLVLGSVPLVMMRETVGEEAWAVLSEKGRRYLLSQVGEGPVALSSDAWLGVGFKS